MTVNLTLKSVLVIRGAIGSWMRPMRNGDSMILAWVPKFFQSWLVANGFSGVQYHVFSTIPYWMVGGQILATLVLASPVSIRQDSSK